MIRPKRARSSMSVRFRESAEKGRHAVPGVRLRLAGRHVYGRWHLPPPLYLIARTLLDRLIDACTDNNLSRNVVCVLSLSKRLPLQTAWSLNGPKIPSAIGAIRPCHTFLATPLQLNKRDGTDRVRDRRRRPRVAAAGTVHSALRIDKTDEIEIMHGRSIEGYSLSAPASLLAQLLVWPVFRLF